MPVLVSVPIHIAVPVPLLFPVPVPVPIPVPIPDSGLRLFQTPFCTAKLDKSARCQQTSAIFRKIGENHACDDKLCQKLC